MPRFSTNNPLQHPNNVNSMVTYKKRRKNVLKANHLFSNPGALITVITVATQKLLVPNVTLRVIFSFCNLRYIWIRLYFHQTIQHQHTHLYRTKKEAAIIYHCGELGMTAPSGWLRASFRLSHWGPGDELAKEKWMCPAVSDVTHLLHVQDTHAVRGLVRTGTEILFFKNLGLGHVSKK